MNKALLRIIVMLLCMATLSFTTSTSQEPLTGQWTAEWKSEANEVEMMLNRRSGKFGNNMSSVILTPDKLQGLTRTQAFSAGTSVNFRLVRDAGTLTCDGWFKEGKGAGHWTFTQDQNFISEMRGLGYDDLTEERLLACAIHDVNTRFIQELKTAGYDHPPLDQLIAARIFKVAPEFSKEVQAAGYERQSLEKLVAMRIHGVDAAFIKSVQASELGQQPIDKLIAMRIFKVTPDFIQRTKDRGMKNLTIDQLISLRVHNIAK